MRLHIYYVYILTTQRNTVLYLGVTNDLERRCFEHSRKIIKGFTQKYNIEKLVYFEIFDNINNAIFREKQLKGYSRLKKVALINSFNHIWLNLYQDGRIENP
jgi:putative endonuclease